MKFMKVNSIFKRDSEIIEGDGNTKTKSTSSPANTNSDLNPPTRFSSGQFNITSYRMHVLETESQYLYEQNCKLSRELKNAQSTNEALVNIIKNKDRQIDTIVHEQHEALLRAHAIEQSMRLMLLEDDKQDYKDTKNPKKHTDLESLRKFVASLKSIQPLSYQIKSGPPNSNTMIPRRRNSFNHRPRYTKPLLPPLLTIHDNEDDLNPPIEDARDE